MLNSAERNAELLKGERCATMQPSPVRILKVKKHGENVLENDKGKKVHGNKGVMKLD